MEELFRQALALQTAGRLDESEAIYRRLDGFRPDWVLANLGIIYRTTGRLEAAEATLRAALRADPANAVTQHSLGMTLLQLGKYAEGWRYYAARFEVLPSVAPPAGMQPWRGESLAGKRLLVIAEQGLGDQILLARFLPLLQAAEVCYAAPRPLVRLLAPLVSEIGNPQNWDGVRADCWTYVGLVPRWLEVGPADAPAPYLLRPERPRAGFGLMLDGLPSNPNNARRLPPAAAARAIRGLAPFTDLSPQASGARDFAETAELAAGLEAIVTVDTSVAHLAGAMGVPAFVMLPAVAIDWWASWENDRTPWYPSIRTIRQDRDGDWAGVIAGVAAALAAGERP